MIYIAYVYLAAVLAMSVIAFAAFGIDKRRARLDNCLLYTSPSPRDLSTSRMPSSA